MPCMPRWNSHVPLPSLEFTPTQDWQSIRSGSDRIGSDRFDLDPIELFSRSKRSNPSLRSDRIGSKKFVAHKYAFLYYFRALLCATQTYPYYFRALLCAIQTYPYYYIEEYYIYIQHE